MPTSQQVSVSTDNATATTTLQDKMPSLPLNGPQGMKAIGPRVTFHFISDEWNIANTYEPYDVVNVGGASYVAIQPVPSGIELDNANYWFYWADPNAQFAELKNIVNALSAQIDAIQALNIDDMKTKNANIGDIIQTAYFTNENDGGGALYLIEESGVANNIDSFTLNNGKLAKLILLNGINLNQLGGASTNDAGLIFNYAIQLTSKYKLPIILNGSYNVITTIDFNNYIGKNTDIENVVSIYGNNSIITYNGQTSLFSRNSSNFNLHVIMKDIKLQSNTPHIGTGINFNYVNNSSFENIYLFNFETGINFTNCWSNSFNKVTVTYCTNGIIINGEQTNGRAIKNANNNILKNIIITSTTTACHIILCDGLFINNIDIENATTGLLLEGVSCASIINPYFEIIRGTCINMSLYNDDNSSINYVCHNIDIISPYIASSVVTTPIYCEYGSNININNCVTYSNNNLIGFPETYKGSIISLNNCNFYNNPGITTRLANGIRVDNVIKSSTVIGITYVIPAGTILTNGTKTYIVTEAGQHSNISANGTASNSKIIKVTNNDDMFVGMLIDINGSTYNVIAIGNGTITVDRPITIDNALISSREYVYKQIN